LQHVQVRAVDFDCQRTFEPGQRLVDGIFGRLCVIENNPRKGGQALVDRLDQSFFGVSFALPRFIAVGFESDIKLAVEKPGGIGSIIGAAQL